MKEGIFVALNRIILPLGWAISPKGTEFHRGKSYGGNAPGEFDRATVVGYYGPEFASMVEAAIDRALATGAAKAKGGTAVVTTKAESDDLLIQGMDGRSHKLGKGRTERVRGGETLPAIGHVPRPEVVDVL